AAVVRRGERALHLDHVCTLLLDSRADDDFDHAVMLGLGQRTALGDAHQVALVRAEVVLRVQLGRPAHDLAQQAMLHLALDQDGDRLVHLVADDAALEGARLLLVVAHLGAPLLLRAEHELRAGDVTPDAAQLMRLAELAGTLLHAQVELLLAQVQQVRLQLVGRLGCQIFDGHHITARVTNWVCTESLAAARRNASRADVSSMPSISYSMRPGWIGATQNSTPPLPAPIRTSIGFLVIGLSGNTRIHNLPPRFTKRVMQRRPASIWRAVSAPWVVAFRPNSPKLTRLAHCARPSLRPLNCLRNLVRLGCNMATLLTSPRARDGLRHHGHDAVHGHDGLRHPRGATAPGTRPWAPGRSGSRRRSRPCRPTP